MPGIESRAPKSAGSIRVADFGQTPGGRNKIRPRPSENPSMYSADALFPSSPCLASSIGQPLLVCASIGPRSHRSTSSRHA